MRRKIIKFGGKSLLSSAGLEKCQEIILSHADNNQLIIVISARGNTTNILLKIIQKIVTGDNYDALWSDFLIEQDYGKYKEYIQKDITCLKQKLNTIKNRQILFDIERDYILAFGEKISVKILKACLENFDHNFIEVDSTLLIKTERKANIDCLNDELSRNLTNKFFNNCPENSHLIVTGFISSDTSTNQVTNLGRNGSNYTATLLADYLNAEIVVNYTHVSGIYSVDPELYEGSRLIDNLNYIDAMKLARLGLNIIHPHTILPLIKKNIPLIIKNTFQPYERGTMISNRINKSAKIICIENLTNKIKIPAKYQNFSKENKISHPSESGTVLNERYIINLSGQSKKKYEKIRKHLKLNQFVNEDNIKFEDNIVTCRVKQEYFLVVISFLHSFTI